ncbi:MAG: hypothetical protein ABF285_11150 [Pacificibacter sp.]
MKKFALALSGLAAISAAPAVAETTYLSFSLDYSQLNIENEKFTSKFKQTSAAAAFERTSGKFTYGGELKTIRNSVDYGRGSDDWSFNGASAYLGYDVTSAITVFASASIFDDYEELRTLTAGAEYTSGAYTFGAAYSTNEYEGGYDFDTKYLYVEYNANDLSAYGAVMFDVEDELYFVGVSRDVEAYQVDLDVVHSDFLDIYALSGSYNIRDNLRLNGAATRYDFGFGPQVTELSLGAGYMVGENVWIDASYELSDDDRDSFSGFGLKVSYEIGKPGVRAADRVATPMDFYELFPSFFYGPT